MSLIETRNNRQIGKGRMGISSTWVNALIFRVMNAGCNKYLIALVSVKISTMDLYKISCEKVSDTRREVCTSEGGR